MRGISLRSSHVVDLSHIGSSFSSLWDHFPVTEISFWSLQEVLVWDLCAYVRLKQLYLHLLQIALVSVTARTIARF